MLVPNRPDPKKGKRNQGGPATTGWNAPGDWWDQHRDQILRPGGGGGGGGGAAPAPAPAPAPAAPAFNESAFAIFNKMLQSWGLPTGGDMEAIIRKAVIDGYTPDMIELIVPDLQKTATWNNRFPGWNARVANGFNQLTVGEYLNLENQYHRILSASGLPAGFYDDPSDFGNFIAKNVSPDEIQGRVTAAVTLANQVDPTARNLLSRFYGVGTGDIAAYFLDANRAMPALDKQFRAVSVGAWAERNGLNFTKERFEDLVDKGVTEQMAAQGYATVASLTRNVGRMAGFHRMSFDQTDAENDVFFNDNEKRRQIVGREVAAFRGGSGFRGSVAGRARDAGRY